MEHYYGYYRAIQGRESICNHKEVDAIVRSPQALNEDGTENIASIIRLMAERVGKPSPKVDSNRRLLLEELPQ